MSREIGKLELPNGGSLTVAAYVGSGRRPRLQFTLEQGEGGIVAYGNTDPDGVAELTGWLETWLLELGKRSAPNDVPAPHISALMEEESARLLTAALREIDELGSELAYGRGSNALERIERFVREAAKVLELRAPLAAIDGPSPLAVASRRTPGTPELMNAEVTGELETPASDALERNDVASSLEDFGKVGEERDAAFTAALERRSKGGGHRDHVHVGDVLDAARAARGAADELLDYCRGLTPRVDLTELTALTHYAARFLEAKVTLSDILLASAEQSRG